MGSGTSTALISGSKNIGFDKTSGDSSEARMGEKKSPQAAASMTGVFISLWISEEACVWGVGGGAELSGETERFGTIEKGFYCSNF